MHAPIRLLAAAFTVMALSAQPGCSMVRLSRVQGSGVAKSETRDVPPFTGIDSMGAADVIVEIGPRQSVTVESDDNILPLIETRVKGKTLVISNSEPYRSRLGVKVRVTVQSFDHARIAGSGSITAGNVNAKKFDASISGSGDIRVSGSAEQIDASVSGSGNIDAGQLPVADADAGISGSGNVRVNASRSLSARISGSGNIHYAGNPQRVQKSVSGSGTVRRN